MSLEKEIEKIANKEIKEVHITWSLSGYEIKKINTALNKVNGKRQLDLMLKLYKTWQEGTEEENLKLFGEGYKQHKNKRLIGTLTYDQKQLRIWYGFPASLGLDHVDSCGKNLLVSIYGHPEKTQQYANTLFPKPQNPQVRKWYGNVIKAPNGVKILGLGYTWD